MNLLPRWLGVLLGGWLAVSPRVLAIADPAARTMDFGLGVAIAAVSFVAMGSPRVRYLNTALGAFVVLMPFLFRYQDEVAARVNDLVVGSLVLALSLVRGRTRGPLHPWRPVVP